MRLLVTVNSWIQIKFEKKKLEFCNQKYLKFQNYKSAATVKCFKTDDY